MFSTLMPHEQAALADIAKERAANPAPAAPALPAGFKATPFSTRAEEREAWFAGGNRFDGSPESNAYNARLLLSNIGGLK